MRVHGAGSFWLGGWLGAMAAARARIRAIECEGACLEIGNRTRLVIKGIWRSAHGISARPGIALAREVVGALRCIKTSLLLAKRAVRAFALTALSSLFQSGQSLVIGGDGRVILGAGAAVNLFAVRRNEKSESDGRTDAAKLEPALVSMLSPSTGSRSDPQIDVGIEIRLGGRSAAFGFRRQPCCHNIGPAADQFGL